MADFPVELSGAVGANLGGTPVVCGGYGSSIKYSEKCFRLKNSGWEEYASMKEKRNGAAAVMHNDRLHVFGGYSGSSRLQTTETINVDGEVSYGPDLPTGVDGHAMTKINGTVSLLSGGNGNSAKTWYYNHDTETFTSGPDLLEGRNNHGSALNVDKVTKAKIVVVTGGYNGNYMDSTKMLINGQWQTGTI
jgi:N-acetylneuraminic acid mutarotase